MYAVLYMYMYIMTSKGKDGPNVLINSDDFHKVQCAHIQCTYMYMNTVHGCIMLHRHALTMYKLKAHFCGWTKHTCLRTLNNNKFDNQLIICIMYP